MKVIEEVLTGYLDGRIKEEFLAKYPYARGFIERTYEWLIPIEEFTELQKTMMERPLLPFKFFTRRNENQKAVHENCFGEAGRGAELDAWLSELAGLPKIFPKQARVQG